jgi:raffinose/stachyose/melibiose transport system substrate-binding protein
MRSLGTVILLILATSVLFAGGSGEEQTILRVGSSAISMDDMAIFEDNIAEFEAANPGVTVQWDTSSGDDYQFAGLPALLQSDTPPDIYFEWGGARVRNHYLDGEAMDISDLAAEFKGNFSASSWGGFEHDGAVYGLPLNQDITIQMWYNVDLFNELGLSEPKTYDEFIKVCQTVKAAGKTPIVMGNADAWVAGNFIGLFLYRVAGDAKAEAIMNLESGYTLADPDFVKALQMAYDMGAAGFVNADMNTLGYEESFIPMVDGSAAMYPLGSWYPGEIENIGIDFNDLNHDYFMLPPIPGGKGDQGSILGLNTGYMVNSKTEKKELAYEFLRLMFNMESQKRHSLEGEGNVTMIGANDVSNAVVAKQIDDLATGGGIVAPPDTGYDLEMAFALYEAMAKVFENIATPQEALEAAEAKIAHLRK